VALARTFPDWHASRASGSVTHWCATRHTPLNDPEEAAGCARTIDADSLEELSVLLAHQESITSRCPQSVSTVLDRDPARAW
jgi:hypothetical protein